MHGRCNALLFEHVIQANYDAASERYDRIEEIFRSETPTERASLVEKIVTFKRSLGITETLADPDVQKSDIPTPSERAYADLCIVTNPRTLTCEDIKRIYEHAL